MQAEVDFVNSLDDLTAVRIWKSLNNRFEMKSAKNSPKYSPDTIKGGVLTQAVSISSLTCQCELCVTNVPGYYIPTTNSEAPQQKGQKEDAMSDLDTARRHMDTRLYCIKSDKRKALKTQFGLADLPRPTSWADMAARLKTGQFILPVDGDDSEDRYISLDCLEWRDPAVKKDRPGFTAAEKLLDASATKVKDAIWVKTNPEDALALLEAFESSTVN